MFVARSTDGYSIRALEARVSEHFHLSQAIRTSRKIEALTGPLDREKLRKSLHHFVSSIKDELNDIGSDIDGIEILEAPEEWTAPACADMVFDAAPLIAYPHTFESGEHSLYLEGLAGSIASLRIDPDSESPRFVADVSGLVGRTITVGEFESPWRGDSGIVVLKVGQQLPAVAAANPRVTSACSSADRLDHSG